MMTRTCRFLFFLLPLATLVQSLSSIPPNDNKLNRRQTLKTIATTACTSLWLPTTASITQSSHAAAEESNNVISPNMVIRSRGKETRVFNVPRVGYSLYKTDAFQAGRCVELALQAGVRHLDLASSYHNNQVVGDVLQRHVFKGTLSNNDKSTKDQRRKELFIAHKLSNKEQSNNRATVKKNLKEELTKLGMGYLDLCYIHSPLTSPNERLTTYEAMLELQHDGIIKSVGVCNYGIHPLEEIVNAGMPPPAVLQLELSPFQQHADIVQWAKDHSTVVGCASWSMLSSPSGPAEGWKVVSDLAESKGITNQQVLIRWAWQSGYLCVPRSGSKTRAQRNAITENSLDVVKDLQLTPKEMGVLNSLNENYPAGALGRRDGWPESNVVDKSWDPTLAV